MQLQSLNIVHKWKQWRQARAAWENMGRWYAPTAQEFVLNKDRFVCIGYYDYGRARSLDHMAMLQKLGYLQQVDHWVPWVKKEAREQLNHDLGVTMRWGHIAHAGFWRELAKVWAQGDAGDADWREALVAAGGCGNTEPFNVAPRKAINAYCLSKDFATSHPAVGLWLKNHGYCTQDDLRAQAAQTYCIAGQSFGALARGMLVPNEYIAQTCTLLLRDYGLSDAQKAGVIGQVYVTFGAKFWYAHVHDICKAYIQNVDMDLVGLVAHDVDDEDTLPFDDFRYMVWLTSQRPAGPFLPEKVQAFFYGDPWRHAGLGLMFEMTPPTSRLDLYVMAHRVKTVDMGNARGVEELALPQLD